MHAIHAIELDDRPARPQLRDEAFLPCLAGVDDEGGVIDRLVAVVADHLLNDQVVLVADRQRSHADVAEAKVHRHRHRECRIVIRLHLKVR